MNILGILQNVLQRITGAFQNLLQVLMNVALGGLRAFGVALGIVVGGLGAFGTALVGAARSATEFAKSALSLRARTGLSYGQAGYLQSRGLAFGVSTGDTGAAFGNPLMGMFGMGQRPGAPNFFSNLSSRFNSQLSGGPMGALMANAQLNAQFGGTAPDSVRNVAAMDPRLVKEQEQWFSRIYSTMKMGGGALKDFAERIPLLQNRLTTLLQLGFLKLAAAIGPQLIAGLERFAKFFSENSDRISRVATRFADAFSGVLLRALEGTLNFLDAHAGDLEGWANKAFDFLFTTLPPMLMRGAALMLRALGALLQGISTVADGVNKNLDGLLQGADTFLGGIRRVSSLIVGAVGGLIQGVFNLLPPNLQQSVMGSGGGSGGGASSGAPGTPGGAGGGSSGGQTVDAARGNWVNNRVRAALLASVAAGAATFRYTPFLPVPARALVSLLGGAVGGALAVRSGAVDTAARGYEAYNGQPSAEQIRDARRRGLTMMPTAARGTSGGGFFGAFAGMMPQMNRSVPDAVNASMNGFLSNIGEPNLRGNAGLRANLDRISATIRDSSGAGARGVNGLADTLERNADMAGTLKEIAKYAKETADNSKEGTKATQFSGNVLKEVARIIANGVLDTALGVVTGD